MKKLTTVIVYDGLCNFEFACVAEIFGLPRPELEPDWYKFETCGQGRRKVCGQFGAEMLPDKGLSRLCDASIVFIPGWHEPAATVPPALLRALARAHERGATLASICSGAFVLAATGLLDGKRATTHWRYAELLQRLYPKIDVDPTVLYVDEGSLLTSAGSAAGIDLCLHIVRRDYGPRVANQVARRLVIAPHREGGQAQFVERPIDHKPATLFADVLRRMGETINSRCFIRDWAIKAAMTERTFIRRFRQATGTTPGAWLSAMRFERARQLLESTQLPIEEIAVQAGLGNSATLHYQFRRRLGITPSAYRKCFGSGFGPVSTISVPDPELTLLIDGEQVGPALAKPAFREGRKARVSAREPTRE